MNLNPAPHALGHVFGSEESGHLQCRCGRDWYENRENPTVCPRFFLARPPLGPKDQSIDAKEQYQAAKKKYHTDRELVAKLLKYCAALEAQDG